MTTSHGIGQTDLTYPYLYDSKQAVDYFEMMENLTKKQSEAVGIVALLELVETSGLTLGDIMQAVRDFKEKHEKPEQR